MDEKELWQGRPSLWNIHTDVISLVKACVFYAILFYCSRYIPANNISVPDLPLPDFVLGLKGDKFYLLAFLSFLFVLRVYRLIVRILDILCTEIELTEERLNFRNGILNKLKKGVELYRIKDLSLSEPFLYRVLKLQNIFIVAADETLRFPRLVGVPKNVGLYDLLNKHVEAARVQKGVKEIDYFNR